MNKEIKASPMEDISTDNLEARLRELELSFREPYFAPKPSRLDVIFKLIVTIGVIGIFVFLAILDYKTDRNHIVELRNRAVICEEVSKELEAGSECYRPNVRVLWDDEYAETHSGD